MTISTQSLPFEALPDSLLELADYISKDAIMRLVERYGGSTCYVPKVLPETSELATVIGQDATRALACVFGGGHLEIPKASQLRRTVRNRQIVQRHQEEGLSRRALARAFDMTERHIGNILKEAGALPAR